VKRSFPFRPSTSPCQDPVSDEAGEDRQQQRVNQAVADPAPEQLEDEVGAVRPRGRAGRVEDVEDEKDREESPHAEAPAPAAQEDRGNVDLLDPNIGRDRRDRDGEVDEVEEIVLKVEHRDA
jgi:hypothetical protein